MLITCRVNAAINSPSQQKASWQKCSRTPQDLSRHWCQPKAGPVGRNWSVFFVSVSSQHGCDRERVGGMLCHLQLIIYLDKDQTPHCGNYVQCLCKSEHSMCQKVCLQTGERPGEKGMNRSTENSAEHDTVYYKCSLQILTHTICLDKSGPDLACLTSGQENISGGRYSHHTHTVI